MKTLFRLMALGLLIFPAGCMSMGPRRSSHLAELRAESEFGSDKSLGMGLAANVALPEVPDEPGRGGEAGTVARKMIYLASYVLGVYEIEPVMEKLEYVAEKLGGYIQKQTTDTIVLRIPAGKFGEARKTIESLGRVMEKSIEAKDVTERYRDLALRLKMRRAYLKNLEELLAKTEDVKQMLAIQQEIAKTIEEIEVLQANVNSLANRITFSTIAVRLVHAYEQKGTRLRLPFHWIQTLDLEYLLKNY